MVGFLERATPYSASLVDLAALDGPGFSYLAADGDWSIVPTLAKSNLPASVAYKDEANVFTQNQTINGTLSGNVIELSSYISANTILTGDGQLRIVANNGYLAGSAMRFAMTDTANPNGGTVDVSFTRNPTGPAWVSRANGGFQSRNFLNNADAPISGSTITASSGLNLGGAYTIQNSVDRIWFKHSSGNAFGMFLTTGGVQIEGDMYYGISPSQFSNNPDTRFYRVSAGVWGMGTTANNALGSLNLANLTASGGIIVNNASASNVGIDVRPWVYVRGNTGLLSGWLGNGASSFTSGANAETDLGLRAIGRIGFSTNNSATPNLIIGTDGNLTLSGGQVFFGSSNGWIRRTDATNGFDFSPSGNIAAGTMTNSQWTHEGGWFNSRNAANFGQYIRMGYNAGSPRIEAVSSSGTMTISNGIGQVTVNSGVNVVDLNGSAYSFTAGGSNAFRADGAGVGITNILNGVSLGSGRRLSFSSTTNWFDTHDASIGRASANTLAVYAANTGTTLGSLNLAILTATRVQGTTALIVSGSSSASAPSIELQDFSTIHRQWRLYNGEHGQTIYSGTTNNGQQNTIRMGNGVTDRFVLNTSTGATDISGSLTASGATNNSSQVLRVQGSGAGFTRINDNGTVVIDSDVASGTTPLSIRYNGTTRWSFDFSGNLNGNTNCILNIGAGQMHLAHSGNVSQINTFGNLALRPGNLGGGGTSVDVSGNFTATGTIGYSDAGFNRSATATLQTRVYESSLSAWQETERSQASAGGAMWSVFGATPIVRPTTSFASATIVSPGGGSAIKTDDTFDGYTLAQLVRAVRLLGLLT